MYYFYGESSMNISKKIGYYFFSSYLVAGIFLIPNAWAGPQLSDGRDDCTPTNCLAVVFTSISEKNAFGDSVPFIIQVFAEPNECLRIDVFNESADQEIVLVSPSGAVWRNDDRASGDNRPLITAATDVKGYYTVQINQFTGNQAINTGQIFSFAYGRYVLGNPGNCFNPAGPNL
jgi:hypothetical protein